MLFRSSFNSEKVVFPNIVVRFTSATIVSLILSGLNSSSLWTAPSYFLSTASSRNIKVFDTTSETVPYTVLGVNVRVTPFATVIGVDTVKVVPLIAVTNTSPADVFTVLPPKLVYVASSVPKKVPVTVCPTFIFEFDEDKVTVVEFEEEAPVVRVVLDPLSI